MTIRLTVTNTETEVEKVAVIFDVDPLGNLSNKRILHPQENIEVYIHATNSISMGEGM
jgi:hypothetical protein